MKTHDHWQMFRMRRWERSRGRCHLSWMDTEIEIELEEEGRELEGGREEEVELDFFVQHVLEG